MNPRQTAEQEAEIQSGPDPLAFDEERPSEEEVDVSAPRTWVVWSNKLLPSETTPLNDGFRVIELEPVLDLLERAKQAFPEIDGGQNNPAPAYEAEITELEGIIDSILTAHGRLDG